ncbi:uncharacterized protein ACA1_322350 [Acanthamoeba castellanii str. Neff]|uniref:Uncharacterized protein n=1 Tax=Acanthamoeba castellanii (strain ATCC 30010 / Neff) TaxID=1257118 RepID=L8HIH8_ACACF|nr:uncharacterized protein ACA1_322350 [Acanthamoeba castellanii str. Neff]ELR24498.1 hypothetical protein ACA1_322350 [Acanthamoeba castellanii str. Neff]
MLTTSMWKRYVGYICHFHDYCWKHGHNFPLAELEAVGVIASFFKSATRVFDVRALHDLFLKWGDHLSLQQLHSKLLTMLCILGTLHVASTALPGLKDMNIKTINRLKFLKIQIIGHKNNNGDSKTVTLHQSSNDLCCPV